MKKSGENPTQLPDPYGRLEWLRTIKLPAIDALRPSRTQADLLRRLLAMPEDGFQVMLNEILRDKGENNK